MQLFGEHDINTAFRNSLVTALQRLQSTVISEFEIALREASVLQKVQRDAANIIHYPIRKEPWHVPPTLAKSHGSEPVQCTRLSPMLGSPTDAEQEAILANEDWPFHVHTLETSMLHNSTVGSMKSSIMLRIDEADIDQLPNERKKTKKVTWKETSFSDVLTEREICDDRGSSEREICEQSGGSQQWDSQDSSRNADESNFNSQDTSCQPVEYESEQHLQISPFWMDLVAKGLHKIELGAIADEMKPTATEQFFSRARSRTLDSDDLDTRHEKRFTQSSSWLLEKLRLHEEDSPCTNFLQALVLAPDSRFRILWSILSLLLLTYDVIMIPVDACFRSSIGESETLLILQMPMQVFWSADILVSFLSAPLKDGFLEMSPGVVAENYMKTWFVFDVCLVSVEWYILCAESMDVGSYVSLLRNLRIFRMLRVIRLLRIARLWRMKAFIQSFVVLSSQGIGASIMVFGVVFVCFFYAHIGACIWHLIGESLDAGWISTNGMQNYSISRRYVISLHYMFIRLQGSSSDVIIVHDPFEILVDTSIIFLSLLLTSVLMSVFSQALVAWIRSDVAQVKKLTHEFLRRHRIRHETRQRVYNYVQANQIYGIGEVLMGEGKFIRALPTSLQEELLFESRRSVMCRNTVFSLILTVSSHCVRGVCQRAISDLLAVAGEVVFNKGDINRGEIYFLRSGSLLYKCAEDILRETPRSAKHQRVFLQQGLDALRRGAIISEVSLFVNDWNHVGDLTSNQDSILLVLQVNRFTKILKSDRIASICALKYARHFIWCLNRSVQCDLSGFDFTIQKLDEDPVHGTAEDHFAFISHFKVEAGTEATLLRDLMEQKIRHDPNNKAADFLSPVFVDSEDLVDLARLEQHVLGSSNLVILLTPGILTRPWCLLEIVVAFQNDVQLVPVEVQRPGMSYNYPGDDWYKLFSDGKILRQADEELLRKKGHSLEAVGQALREMFKKISLPFSPHKSDNVRHAEIEDLMKRCNESKQLPSFGRTPSFGPRRPSVSDPHKTESFVSQITSHISQWTVQPSVNDDITNDVSRNGGLTDGLQF